MAALSGICLRPARQAAAEQMDVPRTGGLFHILQGQGVPVSHDCVAHIGSKPQGDVLEGHVCRQKNAAIPERQTAALDGYGLVNDQRVIVALGIFQDERARQLDNVAIVGTSQRTVEFV